MVEYASSPALSAELLARFGLFSGLHLDVLAALASHLPARRVEPGETVVEEGTASTEMYFILSGELEVVKASHAGSDVRVAVFGPGDWFGEMAVLDVQPRSATVRAVAPTTLLCIRSTDVDAVLKSHGIESLACFYKNIARELSRRLRVADGILAQFFAQVAGLYVDRKS